MPAFPFPAVSEVVTEGVTTSQGFDMPYFSGQQGKTSLVAV